MGSGAARTYTDQRIAALVDAAPSALNTLNELAAALNDDANYATTVVNALAGKANFSSVANEAAMLALSASVGHLAYRQDVDAMFVLVTAPADSLANWRNISEASAGFSPFLLAGM